MKKILIFTPSYNENSGGIVVLHYLCHLLNSLGFESYLVKSVETQLFDVKKPIISIFRIIREYYRYITKLKTNKSFNTPVLNIRKLNLNDFIVVYYEQVLGNPLKAKNVMRYMLHYPGYHTGVAFFGFNEYHVLWEKVTNVMDFPHCERQKFPMKVTYMLDDIYNKNNSLNVNERNITCYMVRKGKGKTFIHNKDCINLDGLAHTDIANIFKKSKYFYSYDEYTMYTRFAAMCGCIPIVVQDNPAKSKLDWNLSKFMTYGIAYGNSKDEINRAKYEIDSIEKLLEEEKKVIKNNIKATFKAAELYFEKDDKYENFR